MAELRLPMCFQKLVTGKGAITDAETLTFSAGSSTRAARHLAAALSVAMETGRVAQGVDARINSFLRRVCDGLVPGADPSEVPEFWSEWNESLLLRTVERVLRDNHAAVGLVMDVLEGFRLYLPSVHANRVDVLWTLLSKSSGNRGSRGALGWFSVLTLEAVRGTNSPSTEAVARCAIEHNSDLVAELQGLLARTVDGRPLLSPAERQSIRSILLGGKIDSPASPVCPDSPGLDTEQFLKDTFGTFGVAKRGRDDEPATDPQKRQRSPLVPLAALDCAASLFPEQESVSDGEVLLKPEIDLFCHEELEEAASRAVAFAPLEKVPVRRCKYREPPRRFSVACSVGALARAASVPENFWN